MADFNDADIWYQIELVCGHTVYTPIRLRAQYPSDYHHIFCPRCRTNKNNDVYARKIPTAWVRIKKVSKVTEDELRKLRDVPGWADFILSRDILRIQPSVRGPRVHPFPYVKRTK